MKKLIAIPLALCCVSAMAQTTNLTATVPPSSTSQTITVPITVTLGTAVITGTTPIVTTPPPAGGSGTTTPPPAGGGTGTTTPPANGTTGMAVGLNSPPNGFLPKTNSEFNRDISALAVDTTKTTAWQKAYCSPKSPANCDHMHLDNTMPYSVVSNPTLVPVVFSDAADSDNVGYPVSATTPTEGGAPIGQPCPAAGAAAGVCTKGKVITSDGDHHAIVISGGTAYEVYQLGVSAAGAVTGYAGEAWNLLAKDVRDPGRNSADAAGLPIYPLLVSYDEETKGSSGHAFRFTCNQTNTQFIYPATHSSGGGDSCYPGMRVRLRSSFVVPATYSTQVKNFMNDLKKFGMYVADNGANFYVTAVSDPRWTDTDMTAISTLNESLFDVVNTGFAPQNLPK